MNSSWVRVTGVTFSLPNSAPVTPGGFRAGVVMCPGLTPPLHPAHLLAARSPEEGLPSTPRVHLHDLWAICRVWCSLSLKTGCSRLAFYTSLRGHSLGMPRSAVIKLHQVGSVMQKKKKKYSMERSGEGESKNICFAFGWISCVHNEGLSGGLSQELATQKWSNWPLPARQVAAPIQWLTRKSSLYHFIC